jgi:hypothetical protein
MATYAFPTSAALREVEQVILPRLTLADPIFDIFPMETVDDFILMWEQYDNFTGLQQVRGLDAEFPRVKKIGAKRYMMEPGVYGERIPISETELTRRRQLGRWPSEGMPIGDLVSICQRQLIQRRLDRIRQIIWTLAATGTFSVAGPNGAVLHTDSYTFQTASAAVAWATSATATPLVDLRAIQLLGPQYGTSFGAGAQAFMNRPTWNKLITNTNASDLGGRYLVLFNRLRSVGSVNEILQGEDLPGIVIYDEGYLNDSGTFARFLPNDKVVIFGRRPSGVRLGGYRMVRNVNNPGMAPGPYSEVIVARDPPKVPDVFDGHNGGPVVEFPGSIVVLTVS